MENQSFCQRVIEAASARPDKTAMTLIEPGGAETTTFGEMLSQIRSIASRLTQEQIAFGDRVALIGENHPHWVIAYLGILLWFDKRMLGDRHPCSRRRLAPLHSRRYVAVHYVLPVRTDLRGSAGSIRVESYVSWSGDAYLP
ncbi:MAG: AMP-binding protein [Blastocatellia bacterium]